MKKAVIAKFTLCVGTAAFLVCTSDIPKLTSATLASETGLAGISLTLDKYYSSSFGSDVKVASVSTGSENTPLEAKVSTDHIPENRQVLPVAATPVPQAAATMTPAEEMAAGGGTPLGEGMNHTAAEPEETAVPEGTMAQISSVATPVPVETPAPVSKYANVGISTAEGYVRVRDEANTESEIQGKLYRGCAATILGTDGDWVKIESGNVTGFIKAEHLAIGFEAEDMIEQYGTKWAKITGMTVYLREEPNTDCTILAMLGTGEKFQIIEELDGWVKVMVDEGGDGEEATTGYISSEYIEVEVEFEHAVSIEEEEEELRRAEEARLAEEEQARELQKQQEEQRRQEEQKKSQSSSNSSSKKSSSSSSSNSSSNKKSSSSSSSNSSKKSSGSSQKKEVADQPLQSGSGTGAEIAAYAQKFVGRPYVYGGTSLTNGADCSGFVMRVYSNFGISIPRSSSQQASAGTKVSIDSVQPGDLIFYASNGRVNHVAMYIGGGSVVHASSKKTGIKISPMYYRTPYSVRRYAK